MQQIADWLTSLGMSEYAERLIENKIDISVLRHPVRDRAASATSGTQPTLTVMLMFKGTGWQVSDVRLSEFGDLSSKVSLATK